YFANNDTLDARKAVGELYYKDRLSDLKISALAHHKEIAENVRTGRILLANFKAMSVLIRPHFKEFDKIKNPEFAINGINADAKRIEKFKAKNVSGGFTSAKEQGCKIVVIDLSKLEGKTPDFHNIATGIINRFRDFQTGNIQDCYVIMNGKAVKIDKNMFNGFDIKNKDEKGRLTKITEGALNALL
ncbi:MAG: hypothetical protein LBD59_08360, partial [Prevotellaceae bacterium]|nr:hypothetical protein [Prevotellaceae bacterium]